MQLSEPIRAEVATDSVEHKHRNDIWRTNPCPIYVSLCIVFCAKICIVIPLRSFVFSAERVRFIADIDEFTRVWQALVNLAAGTLPHLKKVATIKSVGLSSRIKDSQLADRQVERLLLELQVRKIEIRDDQEVAGVKIFTGRFLKRQFQPLFQNIYFCSCLNFTNMENVSIREFYKEICGNSGCLLEALMENKNSNDLGHFNVFDIAKFYHCGKKKSEMTYNRRLYYKISLIKGKNLVEYADKTVLIEQQAILFATPKIPYRYTPQDTEQSGYFCVFTKEFLSKSMTGLLIDEMPIYQPNSSFVYQLDEVQFLGMEQIFRKMSDELTSDYAYKYDLLRNYVMELIHTGQKLEPMKTVNGAANAAGRITSLFIELLERQFPIENEAQVVHLKTPLDFAKNLGVHVNHLNKVLKETTGKSTSEIINGRMIEEAKILLKQTRWNASEIALALGFDEVAHFSNFFKKHTSMSPLKYRN